MTAWCGPEICPTFQIFYSSALEHGDPQVVLPEGPDFFQFGNEQKATILLAAAGFALKSHDRIECHWTLSSPEGLAEIFEKGAPRGGYLLTQQPATARAAIKAAMAQKVRERFAHGDQWRLPVMATLSRAVAV